MSKPLIVVVIGSSRDWDAPSRMDLPNVAPAWVVSSREFQKH